MSQKGWLILFFADLLLDILALIFNLQGIRIVTKPLLMPLLMVWFIISSNSNLPVRYLIVSALFFSWLGDIFLLNEQNDQTFFVAGLSCFFITHLFYILFFLQIRKRAGHQRSWSPMVISAVALYIIAFVLLMLPQLGNMKIPVALFGFVIGTTLILAIHTTGAAGARSASWLIAGAALFIASHTMLGIFKFYYTFPSAYLLIMITYGIAQFAIVNGSLQYLAAEKKKPA